MNKIYIGNTEVANVGSGGGGGQEFDPSDYVDASTWNEHEKVIASALVNLKGLEDQIEAFDESIQAQEDALLAEVHAVEQTKADVSVVYTKKEIDKSDKIVAAALASLNERVTTLETSSGGSGGSGDSFDPEYLEVELADVSARVYDAENDILDVSDRLEFLGDLTLDISSRVDALEQVDYVVTNDISAFVKENDISTFITDNDISTFVTQTALDVSFNALDTSIIALDASVKELASASGGGDSDPAFVKYVNTSDSTKVGIVSSLRTAAPCTSIGNMAVICGNGTASAEGAFSSGLGVATGVNSAALGLGTVKGARSFATSGGTCNGQYSMAVGSDCVTSNNYSIAIGRKCKASTDHAFAEGYDTTAKCTHYYGSTDNMVCHAEGYGTTANGGIGSHAEGYYTISYGYSSHAEGFMSNAKGEYSHAEGYNTKTFLEAEHAEGRYNKCSSTGGSTFGSPLNTLSTIGNGGTRNTSTHNAFEVRQSGDIYISDVSAAGEYYEKPMINLQQKLYALDASIQSLSGGGGGSSTDLTNYVFLHHDSQNDTYKLKSTEPGGNSAPVTELYIETLKTSSIMSTDPLTDNFILIESGEMYIKRNETLYQIDLDAFVTSFGTDVTQ